MKSKVGSFDLRTRTKRPVVRSRQRREPPVSVNRDNWMARRAELKELQRQQVAAEIAREVQEDFHSATLVALREWQETQAALQTQRELVLRAAGCRVHF